MSRCRGGCGTSSAKSTCSSMSVEGGSRCSGARWSTTRWWGGGWRRVTLLRDSSGHRLRRTRVPRVAWCFGDTQRGEGVDKCSSAMTKSMESGWWSYSPQWGELEIHGAQWSSHDEVLPARRRGWHAPGGGLVEVGARWAGLSSEVGWGGNGGLNQDGGNIGGWSGWWRHLGKKEGGSDCERWGSGTGSHTNATEAGGDRVTHGGAWYGGKWHVGQPVKKEEK
jgi:hypothetical protein